MWFFNQRSIKDEIKSLEIEVTTLRANFKMLLDEYRLHLKQLHDPYNKVMKQAEEVKRSKHRGRPRRDRKNDSR